MSSYKKIIPALLIGVEIFIILNLLFQIYTNSTHLFSSKSTDLPLYRINFTISPSNDPLLPCELKPNFEQKYDGEIARLPRITTIKINSDGFRDREYLIDKPNNTFRIVVLGDSVTFGQGVELNETYPKILEKKLNALNNGINYEVLNFGVPGYNTIEEVEMYKNKGVKYNPDMIIIGFVHNDAENRTRMEELFDEIWKEYENDTDKIKLSEQEREIEISIKVTQELEEETANKPFKQVWKNVEIPLNDLSNITKTNNTKILIITFFCSKQQIDSLKKYANEKRWHLIDSDEIFSPYPLQNITVYYPKDSHPNPFANKLVGEKIYDYLMKNKIIPFKLEEFKNN